MSGQPVPIFVHSDTLFGEGSYIEFYGEALDTLYADTNVYAVMDRSYKCERVSEDNSDFDPGRQPAEYYMETKLVDENKGFDYTSPTGDPWANSRCK